MFVAAPVISLAYDTRPPLKLTIVNNQSQEKHAEGTLYFKSESKPEGVTLILTGEGNYDQYTNIRFVNKSRLVEESFLNPLNSESLIYDKKDKLIGGFRILYDYEEKKIIFIRLKKDGKKDFEKTFPLKGPSCDSVNLPIFFERFYSLYQNQLVKEFYLLSSEPKLYKVKIFNRGIERIPLSEEEEPAPARKVQLIADLGPLTEMAAKFVTPTYIWLTPKKPYRWIQYEGLEKDLNSVNIKIIVSN